MRLFQGLETAGNEMSRLPVHVEVAFWWGAVADKHQNKSVRLVTLDTDKQQKGRWDILCWARGLLWMR